jgi:hypothetical protein
MATRPNSQEIEKNGVGVSLLWHLSGGYEPEELFSRQN